jgi:CspA family cold shock protein
LKRVRLTRSTVSDVLLGRKFPGKAFLLTFVDACGVDLERDRRWEQAWDRLAPQYLDQAAEAEADQLRRQLAEATAAHAAALEHVRADAQARIKAAQARADEAIRRARTDAEALVRARDQEAREQADAEAGQHRWQRTRVQGTVKWFNPDKGYGFITADGGQDIFVYFPAIQSDGYRTLEEGQRVEFEITQRDRGPQADKVIVVR